MNRLHNLDYLRGLAALGIMMYHYASWALGRFSAETFMGRLGLYGVSIFYLLSGLTLYYMYYHKMHLNKADMLSFFKKRVFRIFPLLWLVTLVAILLSKQVPDLTNLFLNLTGLFGFVRWDKSFSAGVWSIGNELVFYTFFPFFVAFSRHVKALMVLLILALTGLFLYFAYIALNPMFSLSEQWSVYINPLNQVFLFMAGFLIGYLLNQVQFTSTLSLGLMAAGILLFTFYPAYGDPITLVSGTNRLVFSACCVLICIGFYKLPLQLPSFFHKPLTLLGEISYSLYLLHPVLWTLSGLVSGWVSRHFFYVPLSVRLILTPMVTLIISYFVYHYVERYFMQLGRTKPETNTAHNITQKKLAS